MNAKGPVLVITYWSWKDALIQTYTLPYVELIQQYSGKTVYLVTLEQEQQGTTETERETIRKQYATKNIVPVFFSYKRFGIRAAFNALGMVLQLRKLIRREKIGTIHTWCSPAGAIGYILARLTGRPLILDSFEPHAESMVENGGWKKNGMAFRILFYFEKKQTRKAQTVIAVAKEMRTYCRERYGYVPDSFFIKPALIDPQKISLPDSGETAALKSQLNLNNTVICVYAGKLGGLYLEKEITDLFKAGSEIWGDNFRALVLSPSPETTWKAFAAKSGFPESQLLVRYIPQHDVYRYLALAGFALNPVKPVPSKKYGTSIKDGEYWIAGLPVIITPDISDDSDIIQKNNTGVIWGDFSAEGCRKTMLNMQQLLQTDREALAARVRKQADVYRNMQIAAVIYRTIYGNN